MDGHANIQGQDALHLVVELFGSDPNGRKMIAWGRRIGCRDAGHGFEPGRGVYTRLLVDDGVCSDATRAIRANSCGLVPPSAVFRRIERSFETRAIRANSCHSCHGGLASRQVAQWRGRKMRNGGCRESRQSLAFKPAISAASNFVNAKHFLPRSFNEAPIK